MPFKEGWNNQYDEAWKVALELFFEPFLVLCFPAVHLRIDWAHGPEFLDTELRKISPEHEQGRRTVDKLVKVRLRDGREEWLFIHIEVQAQRDRRFAERLWVYFYRAWDKYKQRVVSLAVLADDDPNWRPQEFETEFGGCRLRFEFPIFKVMDFPDAAGVFERTGNPFALLIATHQAALATQRNPAARYAERFRLLRCLRRQGLEGQLAWNLLRLIQWLTRLPRELELRFWSEWDSLPSSQRVMTIDELKSPLEFILMERGLEKGIQQGIQQGLQQGLQQGVLDILEARFGMVSEAVRGQVQRVTEEQRLRRAIRLAAIAPAMEAFLAGL